MNIPDQTKELKTPSGEHTIVVRSYLTGEDRRANRRLILRLSEEGKGRTVEAIEEAENALMTQIVISVDESNENIIDAVLKMKAEDYDFVIDTVNEIAAGMSKKKDQTSDGNINPTSEEQK